MNQNRLLRELSEWSSLRARRDRVLSLARLHDDDPSTSRYYWDEYASLSDTVIARSERICSALVGFLLK